MTYTHKQAVKIMELARRADRYGIHGLFNRERGKGISAEDAAMLGWRMGVLAAPSISALLEALELGIEEEAARRASPTEDHSELLDDIGEPIGPSEAKSLARHLLGRSLRLELCRQLPLGLYGFNPEDDYLFVVGKFSKYHIGATDYVTVSKTTGTARYLGAFGE